MRNANKVLSYDSVLIWQEGDRYFYGSSERGKISVLKAFDTEKEPVAYALPHTNKYDGCILTSVFLNFIPTDLN